MKLKMTAWFSLLLLASCATAPSRNVAATRPASVAVLPAHAETSAEEGVLLLRQLTARHLVERGYVPLPASVVDKTRRLLRIEDSAGIHEKERQALQARLAVDSFLLIDVLAYSGENSIAAGHRVAISLRLIDAKTGELIWQNQGEELTPRETLESSKPLLESVAKWAASQFKTAAQLPLYAESNRLVERLLEKLPLYHP